MHQHVITCLFTIFKFLKTKTLMHIANVNVFGSFKASKRLVCFASGEDLKKSKQQNIHCGFDSHLNPKRLYYLLHQDRIKESKRQFRLLHKDRLNELQHEYERQNRDKISLAKREYYLKKRSELRQSHRVYRTHNVALISQSKHEYYRQNKDRLLESQLLYSVENKGKLKVIKKDYYLRNGDVRRACLREYRCRNHDDPAGYLARSAAANSWKTPELVRQYFERNVDRLGINNLSDWYRISRIQVNAAGT